MNSTSEQPSTVNDRRADATDGSAAPELRAAVDELRAGIRGALEAIRRSLYLGRGALEMALFDKAFHVAAVFAGTLVAVSMTITASLLIVLGIRRAFLAWSGGAWWIDLVVAGGILGVTASSTWAYYRWMHRSIVTSTREKLAATGSVAPQIPHSS